MVSLAVSPFEQKQDRDRVWRGQKPGDGWGEKKSRARNRSSAVKLPLHL